MLSPAITLAIAMLAGAPTEHLIYEAFSLNTLGGRESIVRGVRTYSPACDILVQKTGGPREA